MKNVMSYVAAIMALTMIGCGGSNSGGAPTDPTAGVSNIHLESIVRVSRSNLMHPDQFTDADLLDPTNTAVQADLSPAAQLVFGIQDPRNFQVSEQYVFQLVGTKGGKRVILPATFRSSDNGGQFGTVAVNSGLFTATDTPTSAAQTMFASYNGNDYQTPYEVKVRQARLIGKVLDTSSNPVSGVIVKFFSVDGAFVGQVTSASDGTYRASVPTSAAKFTLTGSSVPLSDHRVFTYGTDGFRIDDVDCLASLPSVSLGSQTVPTIVLTPTSESEPAITGCSVAAE